MKNKLIIFFLLIVNKSVASESTKWGDLDLVWIEKDAPITYMSIGFSDGTMHSGQGVTRYILGGINFGTSKYSAEEINDFWYRNNIYFTTSAGNTLSTFNISSLTKDFEKTVKMMCHLFSNATFDESELNKTKQQIESSANDNLTNPGSFAYNIFLETAFKGAPYNQGIINSTENVLRLTPKSMREELDYFIKVPKKTIYLSGPKSALKIKNILLNNCKFEGTFTRTITKEETNIKNAGIFFTKMPDQMTQSVVIMGSNITADERPKERATAVVGEMLFGGLNNYLFQEIREKRNLVYSIGAGISINAFYGSNYIMAQTKNENTVTLINAIYQAISELDPNNSEIIEMFENAKEYLLYNAYSSQTTDSSYLDFLQTSVLGVSAEEITSNLEKVSLVETIDYIKKVFDPTLLTVIILGDDSTLESLNALGEITLLDYKDFLQKKN